MYRAASLIVPLMCLAAPMAQASPMRGGPLSAEVAQRAGISPEQQKKIEQLRYEADQQLIPLQAEVKKERLELKRLLSATKPDQRAVLAQVDKVARAQGEVKKNRIALMLKIRELVGPETWEKLKAERRAQGRERRNVRRHQRFGD
ncbi:MAG: periplasmic heavy metal sensor [Myxococcaceae bacterium]|nr:periplasmic heavy metal sensor [Myxococcaceae bacterium]